MAVRLQRQTDVRVLNIAPDVAGGIGDRNDAAQRTAAVYTDGKGALVLLQHVAQHGSAAERAAQSRRGHSGGVMYVPGALNDVPGADGRYFDKAVTADGTEYLIHFYCPRFAMIKILP